VYECVREMYSLLYALALWKEASKHSCPTFSKALATEVCLSHEGLHGDWLFTTESELRKCRAVGVAYLISVK
jgi:hypothetical protein